MVNRVFAEYSALDENALTKMNEIARKHGIVFAIFLILDKCGVKNS